MCNPNLEEKAELAKASRVDFFPALKRRSFYLAALFSVILATVRRSSRSAAIAYVADLADDPQVYMVWVDRGLHDEAVALLLARPDKTYSLCDAVSFVLMRRYGVEEALTTDRHFEQEGFLRRLQ